uniref:FMN reductase (NADPH) n=1 Tax=Marinobacter nauticus TaxID=2743 RepID=A0A455WBX0_MARNT|nr:FMN reductase (NADPH) [Marinobacter nauticus]
MSGKPSVVVVNGSSRSPSRTGALLNLLATEIAAKVDVDVQVVSIAAIGNHFGTEFKVAELAPELQRAIHHIESADLIVAGSPIYRASYSGLFKHLFDLVDRESLKGTPILLAATGGTPLHGLALDTQFRALFAFFQALTLPQSVYALDVDFNGHQLVTEALLERAWAAAALAADHLVNTQGAQTRPTASPAAQQQAAEPVL